jgi:hypothetical protein
LCGYCVSRPPPLHYEAVSVFGGAQAKSVILRSARHININNGAVENHFGGFNVAPRLAGNGGFGINSPFCCGGPGRDYFINIRLYGERETKGQSGGRFKPREHRSQNGGRSTVINEAISEEGHQTLAVPLVVGSHDFRQQVWPFQTKHRQRSNIGLSSGLCGGLDSGLCSLSRFFRYPLGGDGSAARLFQSAVNQPDPPPRNTNGYERCEKHEFCPKTMSCWASRSLIWCLPGSCVWAALCCFIRLRIAELI